MDRSNWPSKEAMLEAIKRERAKNPTNRLQEVADEKDYQDAASGVASGGGQQSGPATGGAAGERLRENLGHQEEDPDQADRDQRDAMRTVRKNRK